MLVLRAIRWHRDLARLGVTMPLSVVHDLGLLLATPNEQLELGPRVDPNELFSYDHDQRNAGSRKLSERRNERELVSSYEAMIGEIAASDAARRSADLSMSDDLVVVLLARLLGSVSQRVPRPPYVSGVPLEPSVVEGLESELLVLYDAVNRAHDHAAIRELVRARLYVLTLVDALDLDTLRLLGMLGGDSMQGGIAQVDVLAALGAPEANNVVDFSLEILPSVLEAKARPGASSYAAHGYAGLSRKGSIDSMVLTELAWDEHELLRRMVDEEVLYYAREQAREEARRVHHMLIDASASMRGERATFARGMAIAAAKKLVLAGEDVVFRFFDSRLYEPHACRAGKLPIGYLLSFKGERGRNPKRVFTELASNLELISRRDARQIVVHLFTHAALYIPRETVAAVARRAKIAAIFMLPSGGAPELDYLDLLDAHWVVDHQVLASRNARSEHARRILDDVGAEQA